MYVERTLSALTALSCQLAEPVAGRSDQGKEESLRRMAKLDPALKHAITPPSFDDNKLHRERLVDALHAELPRKLVVIAAPAGYGKTTLLADFVAHTEVPVCWVGLTEADKDVMRLASVFLASLEKRFRRLRGELDLKAFAEGSPASLAQGFVDLIVGNVQEAFALLVDEADVINSSTEGLAFLDALCDRLPEQVTIYAAGREVLEVSLAKLMAEGALAGYGPHDLALTRSELSDLAKRSYGEELSDEEVDKLLDETTGWITGVILSGALSGRSLRAVTTNPRPMVYEYLASVVLNRQPEDLRRFLLDSSALPVMSPSTCDEILGIEQSGKLLEKLVAEGLFVSRSSDSPPTYQYHPLFREFLIETKRAADPESLNEILVRAADYMDRIGAVEDAVDLLVKAGDLDRGYDIAERSAVAYFARGRVSTLLRWAEIFGAASRPNSNLRIRAAAALSDRGEFDKAEGLLIGLFDAVQQDVLPEFLAQGAVRLGRIAYYKGDTARAQEWIEKADALARATDAKDVMVQCERFTALLCVRAGDFEKAELHANLALKMASELGDAYSSGQALHTLVVAQAALGKMLDVSKNTEAALNFHRQIGAPSALATALNNSATLSHLLGRLEDSLRYYEEAMENARRAASPQFEEHVAYGQADVFNDLGLSYQAAELYSRALEIASRIGQVEDIVYVCIMTSVLHRRRGSAALASEWLKRALDLDADSGLVAKARLQMAALESTGAPENALNSANGLLSAVELDRADEILAHYFASCALVHLGREELAQERLVEAMDLAGASQLEQVLAAEMSVAPEMLRFARGRLAGNPLLGVIDTRIETMSVLARRFSEGPAEGAIEVVDLEVRALGGASLLTREESLDELKPQVRELLHFLVDRGSANRDTLTDAFWPGHPPGRQIANLHMAVYSLRSALGKDAIQLDGLAYSLSVELKVRYDVAEFERVARIAEDLPPGDPRQMFVLSEAIRAYKGPFLLEFDDEWVLERRRNLEMRYLDLISRHADEALVRNQPERAVGVLREALAVDPYRDDLNLKYMELLGRMNRRSELVAHYQRYVNLLASDLGLDPSEDVRQVYDRLIG